MPDYAKALRLVNEQLMTDGLSLGVSNELLTLQAMIYHKYTTEEDDFLRATIAQTEAEVAEHLRLTVWQVHHRRKRLGILKACVAIQRKKRKQIAKERKPIVKKPQVTIVKKQGNINEITKRAEKEKLRIVEQQLDALAKQQELLSAFDKEWDVVENQMRILRLRRQTLINQPPIKRVIYNF